MQNTVEFKDEVSQPAGGRRAKMEKEKKRKMKPGSFGTITTHTSTDTAYQSVCEHECALYSLPHEREDVSAETMGLSQTMLRAIKRKGYQFPTPIQRKTLPLALSGQDVVGMARTGSGKTAAFVIPMLERCADFMSATPHHMPH